MRRKLILTPYEHGYVAGFRQRLFDDTNKPIDIPHILFASMTMAGVDYIETMGKIQNSETKLIKKIASKATHRKWNECHNRIESAFNKYITEKTSKESKEEINGLFYKILYLLFAMETKSGVLVFSGLDKFADKNLLPLELNSTAQILFSSVQSKTANLPVIKYDIEKKNFKKFIEILDSKEFKAYKDAQSEIELNGNLTTKTINSIEKAAKDLYRRNSNLLNIQDNLIKAIPLSSKVIDLFFGKLPGILAEYSGTILSDYLKVNKTIPIYNCEPIIKDIGRAML